MMYLAQEGALTAAQPQPLVVIADDDPMLNELWQRYFDQLGESGITVRTASNFEEIIAAINAPGADPDWILLIGNQDRLADIARAKREGSLRLRIAAFTDLVESAQQAWHSLIELGDGRVFIWERGTVSDWKQTCAELLAKIRSIF